MQEDLRRTRRRRLLWLRQHRFDGSNAALARAIGKTDDYVWQLLADPDERSSARGMGERVARSIEETLELPNGWLDAPGQPTLPLGQALESLRSVPATNETERGYGVPVVGTAQLGENGYYDELAYPPGHGEGAITWPTRDPNAYALRVKGDSMRPRIKPGEFVIVEPNAPVAPGDEVLVRLKDGRVMVKTLGWRRDGMVELRSVNDAHPPLTVEESEIERLHHVAGFGKVALYRRAS